MTILAITRDFADTDLVRDNFDGFLARYWFPDIEDLVNYLVQQNRHFLVIPIFFNKIIQRKRPNKFDPRQRA